jgi:hypothetical protein
MRRSAETRITPERMGDQYTTTGRQSAVGGSQ